MTSPTFGFILNQIDDDPLPPILNDFSIGFIVSYSNDADPAVFPLDTPVAVNSGDASVLMALGTGLLYKAVLRVNAQLAQFQRSARLVIVRILGVFQSDGVTLDAAATMANALGSAQNRTGIWALLTAPQITKATPRLGIVPGLTGITTFAVDSPVITAQGSGYTNPVVSFTPPGATATATVGAAGVRATGTAAVGSGGVTGVAVNNHGTFYPSAPAITFTGGGGGTGATAHAVMMNGTVASIVVDTAGTGYTAAPTVSIEAPPAGQITAINLTSPGNYAEGTQVSVSIADSQGGTGSGAAVTVSLEQLANPLCAALPQVLTALLAHGLVGGPGTTVADALAWRQTLNSQRLIPSDAWEIVETLEGTGTEYIDGVCKELGLAIATDFEHGGYPFHAWANRPIQGALGVKRPDGFSLTDGATDGQELLAAGIGITAAGDAQDASIDDSGLISISINNASSNPLYNLYNKTRGKDFIDLALIRTIRKRLGVKNITRKGVDAVLNDMTIVNVAIQSLDDPGIVGFKVKFVAADNTVERLRLGQFTVEDDTEVPAPITQITINRGLDRDAEVVLLQQLASDGTSSSSN